MIIDADLLLLLVLSHCCKYMGQLSTIPMAKLTSSTYEGRPAACEHRFLLCCDGKLLMHAPLVEE